MTPRLGIARRLLVGAAVLTALATPSIASAAQGIGWAQQACLAQTDPRNDYGEETMTKGCQAAGALLGASAVVVSQDSRFVYVASTYPGAVAAFSRGATGALKPIGCISSNGTNGLDGTKRSCADGDALQGAGALALSPDGQNLYAASWGSGGIAIFTRDAVTGRLTQTGCVRGVSTCVGARGLSGASAIVVSPDGKNVYLTSYAADAVVMFSRDTATGALKGLGCISDDGTDRQCASGNALRGANALAMSSDGRWLYVAAADSNSVLTFERDAATGLLTQRGCQLDHAPRNGSCTAAKGLVTPEGLALAPDGRTLFVASYDSSAISVFARDPATGKLAQRGCLSDDTYGEESEPGCAHASPLYGASGVAVSKDGRRVYVTAESGMAVLERDSASGGLRYAGCATWGGYDEELTKKCVVARALVGMSDIALSPDGRSLYAASSSSNALSVFVPAASVAVNRVLNRHHALGVRISCPIEAIGSCAGSVALNRRAGPAAAAPRPYAVAPGASTIVFLRPHAGLLKALAHHTRIRLMVAALDRPHTSLAIRQRLSLGPPRKAPRGT